MRRLLIEEGADIKKELYVGMVVDRGSQRVVLMASSEGGMDIEEVAENTPEKIHKVADRSVAGPADATRTKRRAQDRHPEALVPQAASSSRALQGFDETDARWPRSIR